MTVSKQQRNTSRFQRGHLRATIGGQKARGGFRSSVIPRGDRSSSKNLDDNAHVNIDIPRPSTAPSGCDFQRPNIHFAPQLLIHHFPDVGQVARPIDQFPEELPWRSPQGLSGRHLGRLRREWMNPRLFHSFDFLTMPEATIIRVVPLCDCA